MAVDINAIRSRLNKLQNTQRTTDSFWKPTPGKHQIRIVPYKFNTDDPFIELYFHYGINNKTYISPSTFGRPDPIVEFSEKLKRIGDREDYKTGKSLEPKLRTFVPIIVRGEENEGVKFWGFGKTVYQDLLGYMADPDYGDITDPKTGRDLTIEYTSAKEAGTTFPTTTIRVKPNVTPLSSDDQLSMNLQNEQKNIVDLYTELSYDELKSELEKWLSTGDSNEDDSPNSTNKVESREQSNSNTPDQPPFKPDPVGQNTSAPVSNQSEYDKSKQVASDFDELFKD